MLAPPPSTQNALARLAVTGAVVGPCVDAIHNQVLLEYSLYPISLFDGSLRTSLLVPPLLAVAYPLLGGILPLFARRLLPARSPKLPLLRLDSDATRAALAVLSTCAIVRFSVFASALPTSQGLALLTVAAVAQWLALDGSVASLALASLAAVGGPLAELPFLATGCWSYLHPDYFPLDAVVDSLGTFIPPSISTDTLGLAAITGPCYFAVTTDAIALGRFFGVPDDSSETLQRSSAKTRSSRNT